MSHLISLLCCDVCPLPFFYSRLVPSPPFFFGLFSFLSVFILIFPLLLFFFLSSTCLLSFPLFPLLSTFLPLFTSPLLSYFSVISTFTPLSILSCSSPLSSYLLSSPLLSTPLLSPLLSSGLWDTRDGSIQPGTLWRIVHGQTLLCSMLGPPPNQRPGNGGVPCGTQTNALQFVPQTWQWSWVCRVEPTRSHPTRLPQAESVCSWGSWLWGWPEQQVGEAEHLLLAGCDSPFRAGYRTPAGTWHKARRYCCWSQLVNYCRWSKKFPQHFHCQSLCLSCAIDPSQLSACLSLSFFFCSFFLSLFLFFCFLAQLIIPNEKLFHPSITKHRLHAVHRPMGMYFSSDTSLCSAVWLASSALIYCV